MGIIRELPVAHTTQFGPDGCYLRIDQYPSTDSGTGKQTIFLTKAQLAYLYKHTPSLLNQIPEDEIVKIEIPESKEPR